VVRGAIREERRIRRTGRRRLGGHEPHTLPREPKARGHEKGSRPPPHRAGDPRRGACVAPQSLDALRRDELTGLHVGRLKHWAAPLDLDYLEIEILSIEPLDVKKNCVKLPGVAPSPPEQDHVDAFLSRIHLAFPDLDLEVEGIVDRIGGIHRRINRMLDETLGEFGLDMGEYKVLNSLTQIGAPHRSTPGRLAKRMELSSGAMTNRLDRLEEAGLVRRLPDPEDRRSVVVELTDHGRETTKKAIGVQAQKEALMAAALTPREQKQLNGLLRKVMVEFERRER
jgi:DNA-binding MarR family transcriptional regulator